MGLFRRKIPDIERNLILQIIEKSITEITPYEKNPRKNDEAVQYVANSIKNFGFKVPIVIDKNGVIVAGHTRYKAAQELGLEKLPCVIADDLTEEQVKAFRLADNKVGEVAEWDFDLLDEELDGIFDIDMSEFGFDLNESFSPDDFGEDFSLPDGDKPEIGVMTFTLHEKQKELIQYAMSLVANDVKETFGNTNKNGNALYEVVRQWAEQRK